MQLQNSSRRSIGNQWCVCVCAQQCHKIQSHAVLQWPGRMKATWSARVCVCVLGVSNCSEFTSSPLRVCDW